MKRFHAHVRVNDLESSVRFYSTLFGTDPAVLKSDYAKWMLDDPRVNFAITAGSTEAGLDHLGLQVESDEDLATIAARLDAAGQAVVKQENASCCYARGNKGWVSDPSGISWETFHTFGENTVYGNDVAPRPSADKPLDADSCCAPAPVFDQCLLRRIEGAVIRRTLDRRSRHGQSRIQRPVPMHRELRPQRDGRMRHQSMGQGKIPRLQRRKPSQGRGASVDARTAQGAELRNRAAALEELGRVRAPEQPSSRFRFYGLRPGGRRAVSVLAGPADHRTLGSRRSRRL